MLPATLKKYLERCTIFISKYIFMLRYLGKIYLNITAFCTSLNEVQFSLTGDSAGSFDMPSGPMGGGINA